MAFKSRQICYAGQSVLTANSESLVQSHGPFLHYRPDKPVIPVANPYMGKLVQSVQYGGEKDIRQQGNHDETTPISVATRSGLELSQTF